MDCVIRFVAETLDAESHLSRLGESINHLRPGMYEGLSRKGVPKQFACSITRGEDWDSQRTGMLEVVEKCGAVIDDARASGVDVYFDLLISISDLRGRYIYNFLLDKDLLRILSNRQIGLIGTVHGLKSLPDEEYPNRRGN